MLDKWSCVNHIQDTIPRIITVRASVCNWWNRNVNSGDYAAKGGWNGRVIYGKTVRDPNGKYWFMVWNISKNRWVFDFTGSPITPGRYLWGKRVTNLDFNIRGYDITDEIQSRAGCIYTMSGKGQ